MTLGGAVRAWRGWSAVLAALLWLSAGLEPATAHFVDTAKDPAPDYGYAQRRLCYEITGAMAKDANWQAWVTGAADNWNSVSGQTGWSMHPCSAGERPDVKITFGTSSDSTDTGGSHFSGEYCQIAIVEDVAGKTINKRAIGKGDAGKGWGLTDDGRSDWSLDPTNVVMHEMSHCLRLSHPGGVWDKGDFEEPIGPGNHRTRKPSENDIREAHTSAVSGKPSPNLTYTPKTCVNDEDHRAAIAKEINALVAAEQAKLDAADTELRAHGAGERPKAEISALYDAARQAVSNIEWLKDLLDALPHLPPCPKKVSFDSQVIDEINFARTRPAEYARTLGKGPGMAEAIAFLQQQAPVAALTDNASLAAAALAHAQEEGPIGGASHVGADGSTPMKRMQGAGVMSMVFAEEIALRADTPRAVVRQLILDDGNPTRPHRTDLFSAILKRVGVGCGPHKTFGRICVIDMAGTPIGR